MRRFGLASAILLGLVLAEPVPAQETGTWIGAGIGGGWTRVSCGICRRDRDLGLTGYLRFGTTLRPGLLVGGEVGGWTRELEEDVRARVASVSAAAYVYPNPAGGLFLKGGIGWVRYSAGERGDDVRDAATNLLGLIVGTGYEFRIAPGLSAVNFLNLQASSFGSLRSEQGSVAEDVSLTLLQLGLGLTWH